MRRVVITGLGMVSPLGDGVEASWQKLINAQSGIGAIENFDVSDIDCKIAGQVSRDFSADAYVSPKQQRRMGEFIVYGMAAANQAVKDSGWVAETDEASERTGVLIGSALGGMAEISMGSGIVERDDGGVRRISPFFIPASLINLVSGQVSIEYGFKGPNVAVATACATGAHAIGDAARLIMWDDADVMIAGGAEAACCRLGMAGFSQAGLLTTSHNDNPGAASRPWDAGRDGFVMAEGAGVVVLEELEHAKARGARIYAEVAGFGMTGDMTETLATTVEGASRCMTAALTRAHINPEDIGYINAHATSSTTDALELAAVKQSFGASTVNGVSMSSTKSATGHMLGAAGAVEAIFSVMVIKDGVIPPTLNLDHPEVECDIDLVPHQAKERSVRAVLSNSFGIGGANASLVFKTLD